MMIIQEVHKSETVQADRIVASLKAQNELISRLIQDIETDNMDSEAMKYRVLEIKNNCKQLPEVF